MTDTAEPDWMSTREAAHYLKLTQRTLYRLIDQGRVDGYRFGRVIRLKKRDIEALVEDARIKPGTLSYLYPHWEPKGGKSA